MDLLGMLGILGLGLYCYRLAVKGHLTMGRVLAAGVLALVFVAGSGLADNAILGAALPAAPASAMTKLLGLGLLAAKTLMRTCGAGVVLKLVMSFKCFGYTDELIHYVPAGGRTLVTSALALVIFAVYVAFGTAYAGPGGDAQLSADLTGVLGAGASANMVHDTLASWFPPKAA